jgi:hypothetical protein
MVRQRFKPFQKAKQAKDFWDNAQEPQEGLVPLFNSPFYATPDTPADPTDCNRYPDSPYCGGFPFTKEPVSLEVSLVRDECNLGIQLDGSLGFIKVPPVQIVYRDPACRIPPPPSPPNDDYSEQADIPESEYESDLWLVIPEYGYDYYSYGEPNAFQSRTVNYIFKKVEGVIGESPIKATLEVNVQLQMTSLYAWINSGNRPGEWEFEADIERWRQRGGTIAGDPNEENTIWELKINYEVYSFWEGIGSTYFNVSNDGRYEANGNWHRIGYFAGAVYFISARYSEFIVSPSRPVNYKRTSFHSDKSIFTIKEERVRIIPLHEKPLIPPPPPKCMCCCPNVEQNDQLLKLILKKIGSTNLPASVPKVLTDRKKGTIKIESLAEFTAYTVKQLDALCGKYPIDIEIEDADLTTEGNQTKKLKLPNIAETLAEMMGLLLVLRSESDATLNATIRALTEAGSSKQMAFLAYEYAKANAEFLGYKGEQKERKVPFAFKPGESQLDKMLQEGEISIRGWENEDKDDFNDLIAPVLELAAMWKVANYRKTGAGDPTENIKKFLKNAGKLSEDLDAGMLLEKVKAYNAKDDKDKDPKDLDDDWDKFTEEAETGFISQPGILDKEKPYGRPLEERPKIRDISSDTSI